MRRPFLAFAFAFAFAVLFAGAPCGASAAEPAAPAAPNAELAAVFEAEHQWSLREHPESATLEGDNRYNDRWTDRSFEAIARRKAHRREFVSSLARFDTVALGEQDRISLALARQAGRLEMEIDALYGPLPFSGIGDFALVRADRGPQFLFAFIAKTVPFAGPADYEAYLARLAAAPRYLEQTTALLREGMQSGWMPPRATLERLPAQLDPFIADDLAGNPLYRPFTRFDPRIGEADRARLEAAGRRVLREAVAPAFAALRRFLVDDYLPKSTATIAASSLPGGPAYYALAVRSATTTERTPRQIHDLGLAEVKRIGAQIDAVIARVGFRGSRQAFFESIRKDPTFYYKNPDDMLRDYRDIAKRVDAELPRLFAELPRLPYGIRAMEAYEGDAAEHYTPGALDGSRAGYFEANVLSLATRPRFDMENTFLHEAVPGHHLQGARANELQGLPAFRRNGWYVAYGEGWALYAESLGPLLGLYRDPYSLAAALSWEMVRACRLVVDTGMHAFGWTREQAIAYLLDNTGLAPGFATTEVDRYIVAPGQALGYKIGELEIKALRDRAQAALGPAFDLRRFHNAVLDDGALPLTILASRVDDWIGREKRRAP